MIGSALALRLAGAGAAVALVVAGYHFTPLIGPQARLDRAADKIAVRDQALLAARDALRNAAAEIRARDDIINAAADHERDDAAQISAFWKGQCRGAFDAGYASGSAAGAGGDPGELRDLRDLQAAGAFKAP